jgi:hypothetical protein
MTAAHRYLCIARLDGIDRVFLWEGEDPGPARVVVDDEGFAIPFPTEAEARSVAEEWALSPDSATFYDLDGIDRWCHSQEGIREYTDLLDAWNLFVDLPKGDDLFRAADRRALLLYDKLVKSSRLPTLTAAGDNAPPSWSTAEIAALKRLLLLGLAEFRARLRAPDTEQS